MPELPDLDVYIERLDERVRGTTLEFDQETSGTFTGTIEGADGRLVASQLGNRILAILGRAHLVAFETPLELFQQAGIVFPDNLVH